MGHVDVLSALWEDGQCRWPGHVDIQCVPCCPLNMGLHGQTQHRYILAVSCQLVAILDNPRMAKAKNCVFKLNFSSTNLYIQIKALLDYSHPSVDDNNTAWNLKKMSILSECEDCCRVHACSLCTVLLLLFCCL